MDKCLGEFHLFEIRVGMGDSCLCGATMMDERGKTVPRKEVTDA